MTTHIPELYSPHPTDLKRTILFVLIFEYEFNSLDDKLSECFEKIPALGNEDE